MANAHSCQPPGTQMSFPSLVDRCGLTVSSILPRRQPDDGNHLDMENDSAPSAKRIGARSLERYRGLSFGDLPKQSLLTVTFYFCKQCFFSSLAFNCCVAVSFYSRHLSACECRALDHKELRLL